MSATSSGIAEPPPPAPERRSLGTRFDPNDDCSSDCGSADEPARRLSAIAVTRDARSNDQTVRQTETTRASPARQTIQEYPAARRAFRVWDRSRHSPHESHILRGVTREQAVEADPWREKRVEGAWQPPSQGWVRPSRDWPEWVLPPHKRCLENGKWLLVADAPAG